jgi:hypothetical protein
MITNSDSGTNIPEIAADVYRINAPYASARAMMSASTNIWSSTTRHCSFTLGSGSSF